MFSTSSASNKNPFDASVAAFIAPVSFVASTTLKPNSLLSSCASFTKPKRNLPAANIAAPIATNGFANNTDINALAFFTRLVKPVPSL